MCPWHSRHEYFFYYPRLQHVHDYWYQILGFIFSLKAFKALYLALHLKRVEKAIEIQKYISRWDMNRGDRHWRRSLGGGVTGGKERMTTKTGMRVYFLFAFLLVWMVYLPYSYKSANTDANHSFSLVFWKGMCIPTPQPPPWHSKHKTMCTPNILTLPRSHALTGQNG